jgi:hypothetical protein
MAGGSSTTADPSNPSNFAAPESSNNILTGQQAEASDQDPTSFGALYDPGLHGGHNGTSGTGGVGY